jgi:hypothetical protein
VRSAPRTPENRTFESHGPFRHPPNMEVTASSFKLRANAP